MTSINQLSPEDAARFRYFLASAGVPRTKLAQDLKIPETAIQKLCNGEAVAFPGLILSAFAATGFNPENVPLSEALALEEACTNWSDLHGDKLREICLNAGLSTSPKGDVLPPSKTQDPDFPTSKASLVRWTNATLRPRAQALMPLLHHFGVKASAFKGLEGRLVGSDLNPLALELRRMVELSGLSMTRFCRKVGLSAPAFQSWLEGRTYPQTDSEEAHFIELLCGMKIADVKAREEIRKETSTAPSPLGRFIQEERRYKGFTIRTLAEAANCNPSTIEEIESSEKGAAGFGSISALRRLADTLELEYDEVALAAFGALPQSNFSERLKSLRVSRLIGQSEMTRLLGIEHTNAYRRYEGDASDEREGSFPAHSPGRIELMASILEVEVEDLYNPDRKAFGRWLGSEVSSTRSRSLLALVAGVSVEVLTDWIEGKYWPSIEQAQILSRFCGLGRVYARELITG